MSVVHNYVWDPAYQNKDYTTGGWVRMSTSMLGGGGGGGGGGVDPGAVGLAVNNALKGSPQPIEGQVALPSDVVNAIGSAVNAAIRVEGALPVAGSTTSPQDLANGGATAPSVPPANGSELNLLEQIMDRSVGAPAWESASVTVGTTSTQLTPARPGRTTVSLNNASTGGQTITLTGGATIPPGAARDIPTTAAIFGVSSAAGGVIHVVETY